MAVRAARSWHVDGTHCMHLCIKTKKKQIKKKCWLFSKTPETKHLECLTSVTSLTYTFLCRVSRASCVKISVYKHTRAPTRADLVLRIKKIKKQSKSSCIANASEHVWWKKSCPNLPVHDRESVHGSFFRFSLETDGKSLCSLIKFTD